MQMLYEAVRSAGFLVFIPCAAFRFVRAASMPVSNWVRGRRPPTACARVWEMDALTCNVSASMVMLFDDHIDVYKSLPIVRYRWFMLWHEWFMCRYINWTQCKLICTCATNINRWLLDKKILIEQCHFLHVECLVGVPQLIYFIIEFN